MITVSEVDVSGDAPQDVIHGIVVYPDSSVESAEVEATGNVSVANNGTAHGVQSCATERYQRARADVSGNLSVNREGGAGRIYGTV